MTEVEIDCRREALRIRVDDQPLESPHPTSSLRSITLLAEASFFHLGGGELTLTNGDGTLIERCRLPHRFTFLPPSRPLTSDWWVDRGQPELAVFRHDVQLPGIQVLRTRLSGRGAFVFRLEFADGSVRRAGFRAGTLNNDLYLQTGQLDFLAAAPMKPNRARELRHGTHGFALGASAAAAAILLFAALACVRIPGTALGSPKLLAAGTSLILAGGLGVGVWMAWTILEARPHFQDDLGYLLRARWLAAGFISQPEPALRSHFEIPFTLVWQGRWFSHYPIGWPALLAVGAWAGQPWLVAPLCSTLAGVATWRLATRAGGAAVGLAAATFLVVSPLNQVLAGSMLSHASTAMWLALFAWMSVRGWERQGDWRILLLAGAALGAAFSTRPLTGVAAGLAAGVAGLHGMRMLRFSRAAWRGMAAFCLGGILGSLPALLDNLVTTGSPLTFAYSLVYEGIWKPQVHPAGLFWTERMFALFPAVAFGWAGPGWSASAAVSALVFGLALVPFVAGRATWIDAFLAVLFLAVTLSYIGFSAGTGIHGFGPRYYVDVLFALATLSGRGLQVLAQAGGGLPRLTAVFFFLLLAGSAALALPDRLAAYRGYNEVTGQEERLVAARPPGPTLLLLGDPGYLNWVRLAGIIPVTLNGPLVIAERRDDNTALLSAFPGRQVLLLENGRLTPFPVAEPGRNP